MIRTTREASVFVLWRDVAVLDPLARTQHLTTARYEPVSRNALGSGYLDLLFETDEQSCVIGAIRLDPNSLITRERSPLIWPAHVANVLDASRIHAIEAFVMPWLRSLARARPLAQESIRRFADSARFDRARQAELLGAAPLASVMRRMAPFVYARRFAAGSHVLIDCVDEALAQAVLADLAASIAHAGTSAVSERGSDRDFARAWYAVRMCDAIPADRSDLAVVDRKGALEAAIVITTIPSSNSGGATIEVPSPAPLDLLFSFDAADAPIMSCFRVDAFEVPLRAGAPVHRSRVMGGSAGNIVLAVGAEALAMRGADVDEADALKQCLQDEGFNVSIVTGLRDPALVDADLVHIFGSAFEPHVIDFAYDARQRGVDYVLDLAPRPQNPSAFAENMLALALRAASDDAECLRYLQAYETRNVSGPTVAEPSAEEFARTQDRFAELATNAVAVLALQEDLEGLRAWLAPAMSQRIVARGMFSTVEAPPRPIGHLVPRAPFAFVHAPIGARSHALFVALATERGGVPLVIAGPCYDVEYLQTLRAIAPGAIVLADADAGTLEALYRRAAIWVDAAPRPQSAAAVMRAIACGALPVLAAESPLTRVTGPTVPTFKLTSVDDCAQTLAGAIASSDAHERISVMRARVGVRRDVALSFAGLLAAYTRVAGYVAAGGA